MAFNSIISTLRVQADFIKKSIYGLTIIEGILTILIGVVSNKLNSVLDIYLVSLVFLGILFIAILVYKVAFTKYFTDSVAGELQSERELTECRRNAKRQEQITNFYIESMKNLNGGTCSLGSEDLKLCDSDIIEGVSGLVKPALDNMGFILDTMNTKSFTIGLYLKTYNSFFNDAHIHEQEVLFVLENGLGKDLDKDLMLKQNLTGEQLAIYLKLRESVNDNKFIKAEYNIEGEMNTIICSPMPYACNEGDLLGVLFIISEKLDTIPADIPNTLTIFNRIISNWVYKYDACVYDRYEYLKSELENKN